MSEMQARIPAPGVLWRSFVPWVWTLFVVVGCAALPHFFVQYWFNQSLGYQSVFWTNLRMQLALFVTGGLVVGALVTLPTRACARSPMLRRGSIHVGAWLGLVAGWMLAGRYEQFLLAFYGVPFGDVDPVFGRDIGFYVYVLPAMRTALVVLEAAVVVGTAAALVGRHDELRGSAGWHVPGAGFRVRVSSMVSTSVVGLVCVLGGLESARTWLARYDLVLLDNEAAGVRTGAAYVDLQGLLSTLNGIYVNTAVAVALTVVVGLCLLRAQRTSEQAPERQDLDNAGSMPFRVVTRRSPVRVGAVLVGVQACFAVGVQLRDAMFVKTNEPYVQLEYIKRHMDATLKAYRLDRVEVHDWEPPARPLSAEALLTSKTVRNAPVLPSWVSSLEEPPDRQHYERIKISDSRIVFGPLLRVYQQEQQLRPYYDFLSVDGVRYRIDGEKRMFASAVRELPSLALIGPKEWLKYWGSAALQFTHGMGLVMSPTDVVDQVGSPTYAVRDVPPVPENQVLRHEPRIYFGEGAKDDYVLTGAAGLNEFDFARDQGRQEFTRPADVPDGIPLDSWIKRVVFAAYTRDFTAFLFSRYIDPLRTRVHIRRTPLSRARSLAPFLFLDSNSYAFIADAKVLWMVNGLTTSDRYPYSYREVLGDKADERAVESFPERAINYAEDSVKITMDAYTGELRLYRMSDDPIIRSWDRIYPDLFRSATTLPRDVADQLTYPLQWFHVQFDDIYKRYHQRDPLEFYNTEDLWDDADETVGSLGRGLSGFGTGDQMTFSYEGYNVLIDPADMPSGVNIGAPGDLQYAMLMPFTPESARNLRALVIVLHDPERYGRLISLQIPQGMFVPGPEQIDAYIDNDRPVHQQVTMWIRHASEVIRGSTLLLPVGGDLIYVETIWVNSLQNDLPQLKLVAVRYHDRITSGTTVAEAIRKRDLFDAAGQRRADAGAPDVFSHQREQQERDRPGGQREHRTNGDELRHRDVETQPAARVQPEQPRERSHR